MIAQQLHRLVQQLMLMFGAGILITPPQLRHHFSPGRLTHVFIHSANGNPTSGATYAFAARSTPSRVTKLLAQFAPAAPPRQDLPSSLFLLLCQIMKLLTFEELARLPMIQYYESAFRKATGVSLKVVPPEGPQQ